LASGEPRLGETDVSGATGCADRQRRYTARLNILRLVLCGVMTPRSRMSRGGQSDFLGAVLLLVSALLATVDAAEVQVTAGRRLAQTTLDGVAIPSTAARNPLAGLFSGNGPIGADPRSFLQRAFDSQGKVQQVRCRHPSSHTVCLSSKPPFQHLYRGT
jgi:hypothetical protein